MWANMCNSQNLCKAAIVILIWNGFSALATVYDSDGSSIGVQSIHDLLAQNGDTIAVPAGEFTWSTQIHITKNITLQGAGAGVTTIIDNVPKAGGNNTTVCMCFDGVTGNVRITGFTIHVSPVRFRPQPHPTFHR
jgi:hypothetical protein